MKINKVECEQFAGVRDKEIRLEDGMNIILGANESGKSTMVDLIYHLLFKNIRLDGRTDGEFAALYFPKKVSGPQGDVIDGVLKFETANGKYRLAKEWEKGNGSCKLTLPDGTIIKSQEEIDKIIHEELGFGAGVFNELVFASQKRQQNAIESILKELPAKATKASEKLNTARADIMSTLNTAILESGGVAIDRLESQLKSMLEAYAEKWDFEADCPEGGSKRGIENKWSCATTKDADMGKKSIILRAYYDMKEIEALQSRVLAAEKKVEEFKADIKLIKEEKRDVEEQKKRFQNYRSVLGQISLLGKQLISLRSSRAEQKRALEMWPSLEENISYAAELKAKSELARVHDMFMRAFKLQEEYEHSLSQLSGLMAVEQEDVDKVQKLQRQQIKLEGQIAGLNLMARITRLGDTDIKVTSAVNGQTIPVEGDELIIREAVEINLPGIMKMQLMPQGIDLDTVKHKLEEIDGQLSLILGKYKANNLEELMNKASEYSQLRLKVSSLMTSLRSQLGDMTWEELKMANEQVPEDILPEAELKKEITALCGVKSIDSYIGGMETSLEQYQQRYGTMDKLKASLALLDEEIAQSESKLNSMAELPIEYKSIDNPDKYDESLDAKLEELDTKLVSLNDSLRAAEIELGDRSAEEYVEELTKAVANLDDKKAAYGHWKHIYEVFTELKETLKSNPVQDIEERFGEYLSLISDGGVSLVSIDEQMNVKLSSGSRALNYDILSEGTKDTIALAFRLAMLEHIYPQGGGMAVFDDPFTDMDPQRVKQSCRLLEKYAENNQVIFITCDDKYRKLMSGNVIEM